MAGKRKQKSSSHHSSTSIPIHDLDVPIILTKNQGGPSSDALLLKSKKAKPTIWRGSNEEHIALIQRLTATGYSTIALSHQVTGGVKVGEDEAHIAIPDSICNSFISINSKRRRVLANDSELVVKMKAKGGNQNHNQCGVPKILKRLNVIIEQESDLAHYSDNIDNNNVKEILTSYDLIALSPRNETVLSAICNSQNLFYSDIIMLDYTAGRGGVQLPFKLKPSYISAATKRGITFELPYGPALIDPSKRKAFVQASRQLMNACVGVMNVKPKPRIIVSSGGRVLDGRDYGAMVLRSSGDIMNFCKVVLGFKDDLVAMVLGEHALQAVERGRNRKCGRVCGGAISAGDVTYQATVMVGAGDEGEGEDEDEDDGLRVGEDDTMNALPVPTKDDANDDDDDEGDGFLRL